MFIIGSVIFSYYLSIFTFTLHSGYVYLFKWSKYLFIIWQSSLIGFYLVALRTVSMETVICRIFLFSKAAKFKSPTKLKRCL